MSLLPRFITVPAKGVAALVAARGVLTPAAAEFDSLLLVHGPPKAAAVLNPTFAASLGAVAAQLEAFAAADQAVHKGPAVTLLPAPPALGADGPLKRVVVAHTGPLNRPDRDDVRRVADAVRAGYRRLVAAGGSNVVLAIDFASFPTSFERPLEVALLGLLQERYVPFADPAATTQDLVGIVVPDPADELEFQEKIKTITALETGKALARDVGGGDPEHMTPINAVNHIAKAFAGSATVSGLILADVDKILQNYPCLAAVARASLAVPRHHPAVLIVEYVPKGGYDKVIYLVGKGVTYDTGGADLKTGGAMRGMSRDKCGAATVCGIVKAIELLEIPGIKVVGTCAFVRNSIGADAYVSDEVITARSGTKVLIGNTDAEGRMAMVDLLCEAREKAEIEKTAKPTLSVEIYTLATLTGHVIRAYGNYGAMVPNQYGVRAATEIQRNAEPFGEIFHISRLLREDYDFVLNVPKTFGADVLQANDKPSTLTERGHQYPAAFLNLASAMTKSTFPYIHFDIAGCAEEGSFGVLTGVPVVGCISAWAKQLKSE